MTYKRSEMMEQRLAGNRERILSTTRQLVAAGGFRHATVSAVAAEAGVSTGLIYRHFPSKAELFVEALSDAVEQELRILRAIAGEPLPAAERLHRALSAFVRRALAGPGLAYAFIAEPVDPQVDAERIRSRRLFGQLFRQIVADGVASGEFPPQDLDVAAACIVGAYTEALVGPTAPSRDPKREGEPLVAAVCQFCLRAVGAAC